jgi:hypothetical protein
MADAASVSSVSATFTDAGSGKKSISFTAPETLKVSTTDNFNTVVNYSGVSPFNKGLVDFENANLIAYCANNAQDKLAAVYMNSAVFTPVDASTPAGRLVLTNKSFKFTSCTAPNFVYPSDSFVFQSDGTAIDSYSDDNNQPVTEIVPAAQLGAIFSPSGFAEDGGMNYGKAYRYQYTPTNYGYFFIIKHIDASGNASYNISKEW